MNYTTITGTYSATSLDSIIYCEHTSSITINLPKIKDDINHNTLYRIVDSLGIAPTKNIFIKPYSFINATVSYKQIDNNIGKLFLYTTHSFMSTDNVVVTGVDGTFNGNRYVIFVENGPTYSIWFKLISSTVSLTASTGAVGIYDTINGTSSYKITDDYTSVDLRPISNNMWSAIRSI